MPRTVIPRELLQKLLPNDRVVREFETALREIGTIEENTTNISTNADDIAANVLAIAQNVIDIAQNAADILNKANINGSTLELFNVANATSANNAVNRSQVIGLGQTWQDVSASRAVSTSYQNTTGKPIYVALGASTGTRPVEVSSDNSTWVQIGQTGNGTSNSFVVPNNYYYRINGATTIDYWAELR